MFRIQSGIGILIVLKFTEIRAKYPYLETVLDSMNSLRNNREYAELNDLCKFSNAIQSDYRLGFSVVSFIRQAITLREIWLGMLVCGAASLLLLALGAAI